MELSERQTPETEAAIIDELDVELVATGSGRWKGDTKMQLVPADFARKLERERDEARETLRVLAEQLTSRTTSPDPDTAWWSLKQAHKRALELLEEAAK